MKKIIKKILREQVQSPDYLEKVIRILEPPYFKNMEEYGITNPEEQLVVMKYIYNNGIRIKKEYGEQHILNSSGNRIYKETSDSEWYKYEYDEKGKIIYLEGSNGYWKKWEYDSKGNCIYFEDSNGYWAVWEYNPKGYEIYYENSRGEIIDNRIK